MATGSLVWREEVGIGEPRSAPLPPTIMEPLLPAALALALAPLAAAGEGGTTPDELLGRGTPTLIAGTAGDERCDHAIEAQARLVRELVFPTAEVRTDASVLERLDEPDAWPAVPVLFGGPHVDALVARLAPALPFRMEPGKLEIGGQTFAGDDVRLITVLPAQEAAEGAPGHPELLLYAGTGTPGVAEINGIPHGTAPILVADTFGALVEGRWERDGEGRLAAVLGPRARRIEWVERTGTEGAAGNGGVRVLFPAMVAETPDDAALTRVAREAVAEAAERLQLAHPVALTIYVYPDRRSAASLTGRSDDGRADVEARALHVLRYPPEVMRGLVQHEATHVLAYRGWGAAVSALLGEGLAVWVSGEYGGTPLDAWAKRLDAGKPRVAELLGPAFRRMPEATAYPLAGLLVGVLVDTVGLDALRDSLYGASSETWPEACAAAGTDPALVDRELAARLGG